MRDVLENDEKKDPNFKDLTYEGIYMKDSTSKSTNINRRWVCLCLRGF